MVQDKPSSSESDKDNDESSSSDENGDMPDICWKTTGPREAHPGKVLINT